MARNSDTDDDDPIRPLLDELYGAPPEEFVATRTRLVRELRARGQRDDAGALAARRRPTQSADALNRLARTEPAPLSQFLALAEPLSAAQVAGRAGDDAGRDRLRALDDERRRRLDQLTDAAVALAGPGGESHREELGRALAAALADPAASRTLLAGHLDRLPDTSAGFDALAAAFAAQPDLDDTALRADDADTAQRDVRSRTQELTAAEEEEREARKAAAEIREIVRGMRADLKRAEKAAAAAEQRVQQAERERRRLAD